MEQASPSMSLGKGKAIQAESNQAPKSMMKNYLLWNARGANNAEFRHHCKSLVSIHQPSLLALMETRMSDHLGLADELAFN